MKRALTVHTSDTARNNILSLLSNEGYTENKICDTFKQAKQELESNDFELVLIGAESDCKTAVDFSVLASKISSGAIIVLADKDCYNIVYSSVEKYGIFVIPAMTDKTMFTLAMRFLNSAQKRLTVLQDENNKLKHKMYEIKIVNRAKMVLMNYLSMSESTAHRYIEKQAMDMRRSRIEVAEQILKTYEN